ncbi:hypothetical protein OFB79_26815, partial [Escherichia coli]|nr:hypothetical protein [Escherichia coli]
RSSRLPGGQDFDPANLALVEKPIDIGSANETSSIESLSISPMSVEIEVNTSAAAMLVVSDVYYPGWRASIDGREAE